jgi:hypothetical protein
MRQVFAVADVDGDGRADLLGQNGDGIAVVTTARSDGLDLNTHFFDATSNRNAGQGTGRGAVGRVDADLWPDVVTISPDARLEILPHEGNAPAGLSAGSLVRLGDLDGDDLPDLISPSAAHRYLLGQAAGGFAGECPGALTTPLLAVGDVDRDTRDDLVYQAGTQIVMISTAGDFCSLPEPLFSIDAELGTSATAIRLADLNADGWLDVVVVGREIVVAQQSGAGGAFVPVVHASQATGYTDVAVGDLTRDGWLDLVLCGVSDAQPRLIVAKGKAGGGFSEIRPLQSPETCHDVALADIDRDGALELLADHWVWANDGPNLLRLMFTIASVATDGDLGEGSSMFLDYDGDGRMDLLRSSVDEGLLLFPGR